MFANVLWLCKVWGKPSQFFISLLMFPSTRPIFDLSLPPKSCKTAVSSWLFIFLLTYKIFYYFWFSTFLFMKHNIFNTKYRLFLDAILNTLSSNPVFNNEECVVQKVCYETDNIDVFKIKIPYNRYKTFLPKGNELLYFRIACRYLEDNKFIFSNNLGGDKFQYIISYEGLLVSKQGGLNKQFIKTYYKSFLQNAVWVVTLLSFLYASITFLLDLNYRKETTESLRLLLEKDSLQTVKILQLEKRLLKVEKFQPSSQKK